MRRAKPEGAAYFGGSYQARKTRVTRKIYTATERLELYLDFQRGFCLDHEGSLLAFSSDDVIMPRRLSLIFLVALRTALPESQAHGARREFMISVDLFTKSMRQARLAIKPAQERIPRQRMFFRPYKADTPQQFWQFISILPILSQRFQWGIKTSSSRDPVTFHYQVLFRFHYLLVQKSNGRILLLSFR
jgi:hypothetical protein